MQTFDFSLPFHAPATGAKPFHGLAWLMRQAFSGADLKPVATRLLERAGQDPNDGHALMDLSIVLQLMGSREVGLSMQGEALKVQQLFHLPAAGECRIRLLAILSPGDLMANTPLEFLLEGSDVALDLLYVVPGRPFPTALPEHDVVFIAVGESDENRPLLKQIQEMAGTFTRPMINTPARIAALSRDGACSLLRPLPGVVMPTSVRVGRSVLEQIGSDELSISTVLSDGAFPLIVRPVGSHAGQSLGKLDHPGAVAGYLRETPGSEFYLSRFVDYQNPDGLYRKYRIILIGGRPFVCHMGISSHWMIHYLNAGMTDSAEKRAEEARFMADFENGFARRHAAAFAVLTQRLKLDYVGLDCSETQDGELLIFEVDSDMIVHGMDPADLFAYKAAPMRKLFAAFRDLLVQAMAHGRNRN